MTLTAKGMLSAFQYVDQSKEVDLSRWDRAFWKKSDIAKRSCAYFDQLLYDIQRLKRLSLDYAAAKGLQKPVAPGEILDFQAVQPSHGCTSGSSSSLRYTNDSAAENLRLSRQDLRSWAAAFKSESNSNDDLSEYGRLRKVFSGCIDDLANKNRLLSFQLEQMCRNSPCADGQVTRSRTLRSIISVRIIEVAEESISDAGRYHTPIAESESLDPIPIDILDVLLSSDQVEAVEDLLPKTSGPKSRHIYRGLSTRTCAFCRRPNFQVFEDDISPHFCKLGEFPLLYPHREDSISCGEICSSCLFKMLLEDICRNWWHNIGGLIWLKPSCSFGCCLEDSIANVDDLRQYLSRFHSLDQADKEGCLICFQTALRYRRAIQRLNPRPQSSQLIIASTLWNRLIKIGVMRDFVEHDSVAGRSMDNGTKFETDSVVWGDIDRSQGRNWAPDDFRIPIFPRLFKRHKVPKECIVCAEEKFEVDYGSWDQWSQLCADFSGPWTWNVLEYPVSQNQRCTHALDVCRLCVAKHISSTLEGGNVERVTCPQCDRMFTYEEIMRLCHEDTFTKYDRLLLLHTLSKERNFRWCLSPKCENGQFYDNVDLSLAAVQCEECGFRMCFRDEQPWHVGLTCAEFESSIAGEPKYKETRAVIQSSTKPCPHCNVRIEKGNGCFHMTCSSCSHDFCWECLVSWREVKMSKLNHRPDCYFREGALTPTQVTGTDLRPALQECVIHGN